MDHRITLLSAAFVISSSPVLAQIALPAVKSAILAHKDEMFRDPDSIRGAKIGTPNLCPSKNGKTCVCVGVNGKNAYGGMTGYRVIGVYINGKNAESFGEMSDTSDCGPMNPFPQLNGRR